MKEGKYKHFTFLHLFTDYKLTDKPISDMTVLQYTAIMQITNKIIEFKQNNKPLMVI